MRQATLSSVLDDCLRADFTSRCAVEARSTEDVDNPPFEAIKLGARDLLIDCLIVPVSPDDRYAEAVNYFKGETPTHVVFAMQDIPHLKVGYHFVERWELGPSRGNQPRRWIPVPDGTHTADGVNQQRTFMILGKVPLQGVPEPVDQVRMFVQQLTPPV